jgi:hypothetical protein
MRVKGQRGRRQWHSHRAHWCGIQMSRAADRLWCAMMEGLLSLVHSRTTCLVVDIEFEEAIATVHPTATPPENPSQHKQQAQSHQTANDSTNDGTNVRRLGCTNGNSSPAHRGLAGVSNVVGDNNLVESEPMLCIVREVFHRQNMVAIRQAVKRIL